MLTLLLPVIRPWTREAVCKAIGESDIPREKCVLILDAPDCELWETSLFDLGFNVELHIRHNPFPPEGRVERRDRHRAMVKYSQMLVPNGPLLCLEDDVLVPPDIYARLTALAPADMTGVQVARHENRNPVVYPLRHTYGTGYEFVEGCGLGCLMTTGDDYRRAWLGDGPGPVDQELTLQLRPLVIDWDCRCGHLTKNGVLLP